MPIFLAKAKGITEANDIAGSSIPTLMSFLYPLKAEFKWVDTFGFEPKGGNKYRIYFTASPEKDLDKDYTTNNKNNSPNVEEKKYPNQIGSNEGLEKLQKLKKAAQKKVKPPVPQDALKKLQKGQKLKGSSVKEKPLYKKFWKLEKGNRESFLVQRMTVIKLLLIR